MTQHADPARLSSAGGNSSPYARCGPVRTLRASAILTAAWVATDIIPLGEHRRLALRCAYAPHASATAGRAIIRVMTSAQLDADGLGPEVADDFWYTPTIISPTGTTTDLVGTIETGGTVTVTQGYGVVTAQPEAFILGNPLTAGEKERLKLSFDVSDDQYLYVSCKAHGDLVNFGTLALYYNLSL